MRGRIHIERLVVGQMAANCYIVMENSSQKALIIDPGDDSEYIIDTIRTMGAIPESIIATHGHFDHLMAGRALEEAYDIPFRIHKSDVFLVDRMQESSRFFLGARSVDPPPRIQKTLEPGEVITVGEIRLTLIPAPGHTPGSICLYSRNERFAFVGDTIFAGGVGRTDFSYASGGELRKSLKLILSLPDDTILYPGHGPSTSVAREKQRGAV